MAEKYVIFKKGDWDSWVQADSNWRDTMEGDGPTVPATVPDGVVIRLQDVFAGHALASYANGIGLVLHLLKLVQAGELDLDELVEQLQDPADFFHEMSEEAIANHTNKKVPD